MNDAPALNKAYIRIAVAAQDASKRRLSVIKSAVSMSRAIFQTIKYYCIQLVAHFFFN